RAGRSRAASNQPSSSEQETGPATLPSRPSPGVVRRQTARAHLLVKDTRSQAGAELDAAQRGALIIVPAPNGDGISTPDDWDRPEEGMGNYSTARPHSGRNGFRK